MKEGPMKMKAALKIKIKTVASLYLEESEMKSRKQVQKVLSVVIFYCPSQFSSMFNHIKGRFHLKLGNF